ncbi:DUF58 domain-containing protein [Mucilaginibacter rubeus]|uniref:DUF58 domain-containing protein n=1 Tax=Mucilaginibacter rubeus TaxID=2027860 RepID=A0AAE6JIU0_9SPHI|nr:MULTISPECIES: DUF58 domain-containing protein [Mucilaginibacter]QEM06564.1 DUF58 domain-containing protein [Mucilaginibacter rubeus]QEM19153.1 DUF58 domain-containing protein [Mucilaginibacter gossypii]QTE44305.1 DUF58 domain-containing protein [Mucilaginibacter rubeus]QTE50905.1 DUF58 domain-containing protein [Mucilaginibacter rubeus]QTE55988.1 DUF58 domain-containing protein [Mucilaginibacter rubeus]
MDTKDLLKKVRKIEIKTRGLSNHLFSGEYHSAFKGRGMAFSEVREYQIGDEIRTIDWNVTARFNHPYVKVFDEERELTVMVLMDVSGSENFGTQNQQKQDLATELCAVLAFSAIQNNDKVGVIFFSDKIEKFIPPKKGRSHILMIIRELIAFQPENKGTNVAEALKYFTSVIKKKCTAFVISDFITPEFENELKIANKKHDIIALKLYDKHEEEFPNLGLIPVKDEESGHIMWVNTGDKAVRDAFKWDAVKRNAALQDAFRRSGVDYTTIGTHESYVKPLMTLFKKREGRR